MNNDKVREEFEEWFISESGINCLELCDMTDSRRDDKYYDSEPDIKFAMNLGWKMWKASRESLCVELPKKYTYTQRDIDFVRMPAAGRNEVIDEFVEILEKAGVNYK